MSDFAIGIVGSRDFAHPEVVRWTVRSLAERAAQQGDHLTLVSGHARGVDLVAEYAAQENKLRTLIFPVTAEEWARSKRAGFDRNSRIIEYSDGVIAFWDGVSRGTYDSIVKAGTVKKMARIYIGDLPRVSDPQETGEWIAKDVLEWLHERAKRVVLGERTYEYGHPRDLTKWD